MFTETGIRGEKLLEVEMGLLMEGMLDVLSWVLMGCYMSFLIRACAAGSLSTICSRHIQRLLGLMELSSLLFTVG